MMFGRIGLSVSVAALVSNCAPFPRTPHAPSPIASRLAPATHVATAPRGMVVSASGIASEVGRNVLAAGGNAVDAAIATGFALEVTYPVAGNIGGGGFMVIRFPDGRATTFDFREAAPRVAAPEMFLDSTGKYSWQTHHGSFKSVGVPGTVAGFALAHQKYGKMSWAQLVTPAESLASKGFAAPPGLAHSLASMVKGSGQYPASVAAYSKNGQPYAAGEIIRQPDLARTLARIRDQGRDGFYLGETARLLSDAVQKGGGLITMEDLASYQAKERPPIRGTYRGYEIVSMGPPSSGGVALLEMLNILEGYDLSAAGHNSPKYIHLVAEAMRRAFVDRARYLGDVDFVSVPIDRLTSKSYAANLRRTIDNDRATVSTPTQVAQGFESSETTHYSVVDADGMAVSVTYTLEFGYGLGAVVPGAGFLLNNEMGDFNAQPGVTDTTGLIGTPANVAGPGKRMLSSMTPTIVSKNGKLFSVVGSPGGRTIINTVLQVILDEIDFNMSLPDAVNAPRIHHQWLPDVLNVEDNGLPASTVSALTAMGYSVRMRGEQGTAHSIWVDPATGMRQGVADRRDSDAGAAGY